MWFTQGSAWEVKNKLLLWINPRDEKISQESFTVV